MTHHSYEIGPFSVSFRETDSIDIKDIPGVRANEVIPQIVQEIYRVFDRYKNEGKIDLWS